MIDINTTLSAVTLIAIITTFTIIRFFPSNYIKEKAKNLATKEDISKITKEIESIKTEHQKQLEIFKSQIWREQQSLIWLKENRNNQIKILTDAISTMGRFVSHVQDTSFASICSDSCLELSAKKDLSEQSREYYRKEYEDYRKKSNELLSELDSIKYKLDELHTLSSIYFDSVTANEILEVKNLGGKLFSNVMPPRKTKHIINENYNSPQSIIEIREFIAVMHAKECHAYDFNSKIQAFYDKAYQIISASTPTPSD